jgi:hypothetical protein
MDVISGAASFASLLDVAYKLGGWVHDSVKAPKERQKLLDGLDRLRSVIKTIDERRKEANSGDPWYDGLLELIETSGTLTLEGKYEPNPRYTSPTALSKLYIVLEKLSKELSPADGFKKHSQRLRYHWDKTKFEELLREFARCREEISLILDQDNWKLSKAIRQDGAEMLLHVAEIRTRVLEFEHYQKTQDERLVHYLKTRDEQLAIREEKTIKAAMEDWLSPLEFLARQEEVFEDVFGTGKWFLDSPPFRHWVKGKPWHLRLYGVEGSGKVSTQSPSHAPYTNCF